MLSIKKFGFEKFSKGFIRRSKVIDYRGKGEVFVMKKSKPFFNLECFFPFKEEGQCFQTFSFFSQMHLKTELFHV